MTDLTKPTDLEGRIWAESGTITSPDTLDILDGWDVGEKPPAQFFNYWQNRTDKFLSYLMQKGIPEWDINTLFIANKSFVTQNGNVYLAKQNHSGQNPSLDITFVYWKLILGNTEVLYKLEVVTNVAALRLVSSVGVKNASTRGYYTDGDGGHGTYWYDSTDTTSADNGFTVIVGTDGARWKLQPVNGYCNVRQAGCYCAGATDDSARLVIAHTASNVGNFFISYADVSEIGIAANALIPIKKSVDFSNAKIVIIGGVMGTPSFSTFNTLFVVSDDECPVVTVTSAVAAADLAKGSSTPTFGLFDGHGYADITCGLQVPDRLKTGTMNYVQAFKVNRLGQASHALSTSLAAFAASITVNYRKTSASKLTLKNINIDEGLWNNQIIFDINRCNVTVDNFTLLFSNGLYNNICELIKITRSSDIVINDFVTTGRPVTASNGSYCLAVFGGADIFVNRMNALTGWGATGTDDINGLYFNNCALNRIDCHSSAHNIFTDQCSIHQEGIVYGWGGGIIRASNSTFYNCPVIAQRSDYGGTFFGDLIVRNVDVSAQDTSTYYAVDLLTNPVGASTSVQCPEKIIISGLNRIAKATGTGEIVPLAIQISGTTTVKSPEIISINNITSLAAWRFGLRLDIFNLERSVASGSLNIEVSNIHCDSGASSAASVLSTGFLDFAGVLTPSTRPNLVVKFNNVDNIGFHSRMTNSPIIGFNYCSINAVVVDTGAATQPNITYNFCRFVAPSSGFASAPVGGTTSGSGAFTSICNSDIANSAFDFSLVAALIGNTTRSPGTAMTWPAAVTPALAFTGWRKAGYFA